jgi:hypothetical protein
MKAEEVEFAAEVLLALSSSQQELYWTVQELLSIQPFISPTSSQEAKAFLPWLRAILH